MRKRKIAIPTARALRVRTDRIAELNVSVIVQSGLALWMQSRIEPVALGGGKIHFPKVFPITDKILLQPPIQPPPATSLREVGAVPRRRTSFNPRFEWQVNPNHTLVGQTRTCLQRRITLLQGKTQVRSHSGCRHSHLSALRWRSGQGKHQIEHSNSEKGRSVLECGRRVTDTIPASYE
jgi:hypothetical protein